MSDWTVVTTLPRGRRAPCEWCNQIVEPDQPRSKLWHPTMTPRPGMKNGPGMWMHEQCAIELLADNVEVEE